MRTTVSHIRYLFPNLSFKQKDSVIYWKYQKSEWKVWAYSRNAIQTGKTLILNVQNSIYKDKTPDEVLGKGYFSLPPESCECGNLNIMKGGLCYKCNTERLDEIMKHR
jgi:hypothetical protein